MFNKINLYVFIQILKSCTLIFFIFLSISWLLQLTRLFTLTNLIQIDILSILYLSLFLIPNLLTVITPFILIFGIVLCFLKLNRDREIIAIFSLGLKLEPIKYSFIAFSLLVLIISMALNFYISPKIYEKYKIKEFELRNTVNIDKMVISNFIKINKDTIIDFKKNNNLYEDIFISFFDINENIIFAKNGFINNDESKYSFQLNDGFKISINKGNEIEKLEFENYVLNIINNSNEKYDNFDRNSFTIIDDLKTNNYLNITFKIFDIIICLFIIYYYYKNNVIRYNLQLNNNIYFIISSVFLLIVNQLLKNYNITIIIYTFSLVLIISCILFLTNVLKRYE